MHEEREANLALSEGCSSVAYETDATSCRNFRVIAAFSVACVVLLFYILAFFLLRSIYQTRSSSFFPEYISAYGNSLPYQQQAFIVTLVFLIILAAGNVAGRISQVLASNFDPPFDPIAFFVGRAGKMFSHLTRGRLYLYAIRPCGLTALIFVLTIAFWAGLIQAFLIFVKFDLQAINLFASDPHIYNVFSKAALQLAEGTGAAKGQYGFMYPVVFYILSGLGLGKTYSLAYDMVLACNVLFSLLWLFLAYRLDRASTKVTFLLVGIALTVGPLFRLDGFQPSLMIYANLSAYRYMPYVMVLFYCLQGSEHRIFTKSIICAIGATIALLISPDTGMVAVIGFSGIIVLHDKIDKNLFARLLIFLACLAVSLLLTQMALKKSVHIDLVRSIYTAFASGSQGFANSPIQIFDINWVSAFFFVFALCFYSMDAWTKKLTAEHKSIVLLSGMMVIWLYYYLYRPAYLYWIYSAAAMLLAVPLLNDGHRTRQYGLQVVTLLVLTTLSLGNLAASAQALDEAGVPKPLYHFEGSISTNPEWLDVVTKRASDLRIINITPDFLVVTALPFLASQMTPTTRPPEETVFLFNNPAFLKSWKASLCRSLPAGIIYDGRDMEVWEPGVANSTKLRIQNELRNFYRPALRTNTVDVWLLDPTKSQAECATR